MASLPSYKELKSLLPLARTQQDFITKSRQTIRDILNGDDPRLLLIVGPCSIHDIASAKEFANHLKALTTEISHTFFIAMRVYCEKPRTINGWKGFLYDPFLDGTHQIDKGIYETRQLLLELAEANIPAATEFLDPVTAFYFEDLISWGSIGARTSSSQPHRQLASRLDMPVGIKNGTSGNISGAVMGVCSASHSHTIIGLDGEGHPSIITTDGNPDAHIVLRGGDTGPNYDTNSISNALERLKHIQLPLRVIVDCSHQNSNKQYDRQPAVFQSVIEQALTNPSIRGLMLESHLFAGNQSLSVGPSKLKYGISITDGCLDWFSTSTLIQQSAHYLTTSSCALVES